MKPWGLSPAAQLVVILAGLAAIALDHWYVSLLWLTCVATAWISGYAREALDEVGEQHERIV